MPIKNTNHQILVVDDDEAIRWTLREALQSWGFETVEAATVAEAVKQFKTEVPEAALLDIALPDGSGLDVLRESNTAVTDEIVFLHKRHVTIPNTISAD